MTFNEIWPALRGGKQFTCGGKQYAVRDGFLHRDGVATETLSLEEATADDWALAIDKTKVYKTSSGETVRLYAADGAPKHVIHGAVETATGWTQSAWNLNGESTVSAYWNIEL